MSWPTVVHDERYGHVTVHSAGAYPNGVVAVIIDTGDTCQIQREHGSEPVSLTEDEARDLAAALVGWAGRKRLVRARKGTGS